jgi:hypothetical protein
MASVAIARLGFGVNGVGEKRVVTGGCAGGCVLRPVFIILIIHGCGCFALHPALVYKIKIEARPAVDLSGFRAMGLPNVCKEKRHTRDACGVGIPAVLCAVLSASGHEQSGADMRGDLGEIVVKKCPTR